METIPEENIIFKKETAVDIMWPDRKLVLHIGHVKMNGPNATLHSVK